MDVETILHTASFSVILCFVVFRASYTFHVWRSRNSAARAARDSHRKLGDRLPRWAAGAIAAGCILLLVAGIWPEARPREGVLPGDGLYTVRTDAELCAFCVVA